MKTDYKFGEVYELGNQVGSYDDAVNFRNVFETENGGVALVGFKAGQKLDTHTAPAEVMITVLEGSIDFTMLDRTHTLNAGEFLLMGANVPHSVKAKKNSKVMIVKVKN